MDWMLIFFVVSLSATDKVVSPVTVPMATETLCNEAKAKLTDAYKQTIPVNFMVVGECLKTR